MTNPISEVLNHVLFVMALSLHVKVPRSELIAFNGLDNRIGLGGFPRLEHSYEDNRRLQA